MDTVLSILALLTASITLITTVMLLVKSRKQTASIQEVHILVNQQKTNLEDYQRELIHSLKQAGVDVPENPHPSP